MTLLKFKQIQKPIILQASIPIADTANIDVLFSNLANRLNAATGEADWKNTPNLTLARINSAAFYVTSNSISLTYSSAAKQFTADLRTQNSSSINLSVDASGLKADYNSTFFDGRYVPLARIVTINGSAQTLVADRTFTITTTGTAGRIAVSGGAGLTPTIDLVASGVAIGTYNNVTVDTYGRVTSGSNVSNAVTSVFGRTGVVVAVSGDYNTSQVTENTNLYYTQARFDSAFSAKTTTNLSEGANLYYTDVRSRASLSFVAGSGAYNSTTGVITIPTNNNQIANGAGYLTANQTITLSGDVSGSGTTAITTTLATVNSNIGTFQGITVNAKGLVTAATNMNYALASDPTNFIRNQTSQQASSNFNISTNGIIGGALIVGLNATIYGLTVGKGNAGVNQNTAFGVTVLNVATGNFNTAIGYRSLESVTSGEGNTALGNFSGNSITTGSNNIFIGNLPPGITTGSGNTIIGNQSSLPTNLTNNLRIQTGLKTIFLHDGTKLTIDSDTYLIGHLYPNSHNTYDLGTSGTKWRTMYATSFNAGGSASQFLKANGSVDNNTYLTSYSETDTLQSVTTRGSTTTANITANQFNGSGAGLTGTASSLSIGGNATSATTSTNLYGSGGSYIASSTSGQSYSNAIQIREVGLGGAQGNNMIYAPRLGFHWGGVVASSIAIEANGRIGIFNNPGTGYESFIAGDITGASFNGSGSGLTGTAGALNIGGTSGSISGFNNPTTAATANTIVYRGSAGGILATTGSFAGTVTPTTDASFNLGSSTLAWQNIYVRNIVGNGTIKVYNNFEPQSDNLRDLGGSSIRWRFVYYVTLSTASDERLKNIDLNFKYGLGSILQIKPVEFTWKTGDDKDNRLGFSAQQLQTVIPEAVHHNKDTDYYGIKQGMLDAVFVKGIQDLYHDEITPLKNEIRILKNKIKQLEKK